MWREVDTTLEQTGESLTEAYTNRRLPQLQHQTTAKLSEARAEKLLDKYKEASAIPERKEHSLSALARLRGIRSRTTNAWLDAFPIIGVSRLSDSDIRGWLRFCLGVPLVRDTAKFYKCLCGAHDASCDHAMSCNHMSGQRTSRHDIICQSVRFILSTSGSATQLEPKERNMKGAKVSDRKKGQRGDVAFTVLDQNHNVDVSVIHPGCMQRS